MKNIQPKFATVNIQAAESFLEECMAPFVFQEGGQDSETVKALEATVDFSGAVPALLFTMTTMNKTLDKSFRAGQLLNPDGTLNTDIYVVDSRGRGLKQFVRAEVLDQAGNVLHTAEPVIYWFGNSIYLAEGYSHIRPSDGSGEGAYLDPQWASRDAVRCEIPTLPNGDYFMRLTIDPYIKWGQTRAYTVPFTYNDGTVTSLTLKMVGKGK